jgi:PRTRC genetic system protein C
MPITVTQLERKFFFDGRRLADPDPSLPIEEVRAQYATTYPALNNASYTEENTDSGLKIVFTTAVGTKG